MALNSDLRTSTLSRSLNDRHLVGLHSKYGDPGKFTVGWIVALSDQFYIAATVDDLGRADGYQAGYVDDLFLVVSGGSYLTAVSKAMIDHLERRPDLIGSSRMVEVLEQLKDRSDVVTLHHLNDWSYSGVVSDFDEEFVVLDAYSDVGQPEGHHLFRMEDIRRIAFNGPEQLMIRSLK